MEQIHDHVLAHARWVADRYINENGYNLPEQEIQDTKDLISALEALGSLLESVELKDEESDAALKVWKIGRHAMDSDQ